MIIVKNQDLMDSDANFIILPVDFTGEGKYWFVKKIFKDYPHVEKAYNKLVARAKKNHFDREGLIQYVPMDSWALVWLTDSTNPDCTAEEYDTEYKYFINAFIQENIKLRGNSISLKTIKQIFNHIAFRAKLADGKVAIPYSFGISDTTDWKAVNKAMHDIFDKYGIDVDICKPQKK